MPLAQWLELRSGEADDMETMNFRLERTWSRLSARMGGSNPTLMRLCCRYIYSHRVISRVSDQSFTHTMRKYEAICCGIGIGIQKTWFEIALGDHCPVLRNIDVHTTREEVPVFTIPCFSSSLVMLFFEFAPVIVCLSTSPECILLAIFSLYFRSLSAKEPSSEPFSSPAKWNSEHAK